MFHRSVLRACTGPPTSEHNPPQRSRHDPSSVTEGKKYIPHFEQSGASSPYTSKDIETGHRYGDNDAIKQNSAPRKTSDSDSKAECANSLINATKKRKLGIFPPNRVYLSYIITLLLRKRLRCEQSNRSFVVDISKKQDRKIVRGKVVWYESSACLSIKILEVPPLLSYYCGSGIGRVRLCLVGFW